MPTVLELFGQRPVETRLMYKDSKYKGWEGDIPLVAPDLIMGLELEIESFGDYDDFPFGCNVTEDGSLRNGGREVITLPTKTKYLQRVLENVFKKHNITPANYSDRCSTHVHINVQDFNPDQLKNVALTYQVVERLLYKWVGEEREGNIYCVPWYQTNLNQTLVDQLTRDITRTCRRWIKYTALNLVPVQEQGTLEFRHLYGTCDVNIIMKWVNILASLVEYARRQDHTALSECILNMNTVSNYDMFLRDVFGQTAELFTALPDYKAVLGVGVVDTKLMLMKPKLEGWQIPGSEENMSYLLRMHRTGVGMMPNEGMVDYIDRTRSFYQALDTHRMPHPGPATMWQYQNRPTAEEQVPAPPAPRRQDTPAWRPVGQEFRGNEVQARPWEVNYAAPTTGTGDFVMRPTITPPRTPRNPMRNTPITVNTAAQFFYAYNPDAAERAGEPGDTPF